MRGHQSDPMSPPYALSHRLPKYRSPRNIFMSLHPPGFPVETKLISSSGVEDIRDFILLHFFFLYSDHDILWDKATEGFSI